MSEFNLVIGRMSIFTPIADTEAWAPCVAFAAAARKLDPAAAAEPKGFVKMVDTFYRHGRTCSGCHSSL